MVERQILVILKHTIFSGCTKGIILFFALAILGCKNSPLSGEFGGSKLKSVFLSGDSSGSAEMSSISLGSSDNSVLYFLLEKEDGSKENGMATWSSSDTGVATVTPLVNGESAQVSAISVGTATIAAESSEFSVQLTVTVVAALTQQNFWTWLGGSKLRNQFGNYGTRGVESPSNFPGARKWIAHWYSGGHYYLFGGSGYGESTGVGRLNDLWRFNPSNNQWTWISGDKEVNASGTYGVLLTPSTSNTPGARNDPTFSQDASGNFWLMGGSGLDSLGNSGYLDDVWRFNPTTSEWTWMGGANLRNSVRNFGTVNVEDPANTPGARICGNMWVNSTHLYLFGGSFSGAFQWQADFWRLNLSTGEWAHLAQQTGTNGGGSYGIQGVSNASNYPGKRYAGAYWTQDNNTFWMWGGEGTGENGSDHYLNDLWKYDVSTGNWTWMTGSKIGGAQAVLGTKLVSDSANTPGGATVTSFAADPTGSNLYLLGGWGRASSGGEQHLNILYKYNTSSNQWTWMAGNDGGGAQPAWGALDEPAASNNAGYRENGAMWAPETDKIYYFGGDSRDELTNTGRMSDLWRYY